MGERHGAGLRPEYVFDASPLSAFARTGRLDLLERRYQQAAVWTVEVQDEIRRGMDRHPDLRSVLHAPWLGEPVRMTDPAELRKIEETRWALGGTPDTPERHRGEAATIVHAARTGRMAILDDADARRLAQSRKVAITGTAGILKACVHDGWISADEANALVEEMRQIGFRLPPWATREYFADP
jgi:predicted nucleic acid-binding protein